MDEAAAIAADLLKIGAIKIQPDAPFTWASGMRSPMYTDNRVALAYPEVRARIVDGLTRLTKMYTGVDAIVGVATAGIPHATLLADRLGLPLGYVRASAKQHGRQNQIEGQLRSGQRVIVVEDLVSTGGSSLDAVQVLRDSGVNVLATLAIFSYGFETARARFAAADCPLHTLTNFATLVAEAERRGSIASADVATLHSWHAESGTALA